MVLPIELLEKISAYGELSVMVGIDRELDEILQKKASITITRSMRKYTKDKKNYWESIRQWACNRLYLTNYLMSDRCMKRYLPKKIKHKTRSTLDKIKILAMISHMKQIY